MGLETAAIVLAGVTVGSEVAKANYQEKAAQAKTHALDLQAKELKLQSTQKTLSNYDIMEKVLSAQEAHMTTTGTAFSSPSFNAIQRDTINTGVKSIKNNEIESDLALENIEIEKENVKNSLYASLFGDVAETATAGFSVYSKMPRMSGG